MEDRVKRRRLVDIETSSFSRARQQFEAATRSQVNGGGINATSVSDVLSRKQEVVDHIRGFEHTFIGIDEASHFHDTFVYGQAASRLHRPVEEQLAKFGDADLIMEMLKRGYAAMKLPSDGGPPEVLRGKD